MREATDYDEYEVNFADRAYKPRLSDVKILFQTYNGQLYGCGNGPELIEKVKEKVDEYNTINSKDRAKMEYEFQLPNDKKIGDVNFSVAVVTPLMIRVHQNIRASSELVFMDSTSNLDELNLRLFFMCAHSPAGGLPLAVFITSNETEEMLKMALALVQKCLPENAFFGKGKDKGPDLLLTDHNKEERAALQHICQFTFVYIPPSTGRLEEANGQKMK